MIKQVGVLVCLVGIWTVVGGDAFTDEQICYKFTSNVCKKSAPYSSGKTTKAATLKLNDCNALYSGLRGKSEENVRKTTLSARLQEYVFEHISQSYRYLLLSTLFGGYEKERPGLESLYHKLSDEMWEDSIELIQYINKRGHSVDFDSSLYEEYAKDLKEVSYKKHALELNNDIFDIIELTSLSKALDMQKTLAKTAHVLHGEAARHNSAWHDPEVSSFIENEYVHKHAKNIRLLSGHVNDLLHMLNGTKEVALSLYLFDQYLVKSQ